MGYDVMTRGLGLPDSVLRKVYCEHAAAVLDLEKAEI